MASNPPHRGSRFQPGPTTVARVQLFSSLLNITETTMAIVSICTPSTSDTPCYTTLVVHPAAVSATRRREQAQTPDHAAAQVSGLQKDPKTFRPQRNVLVAFIILTLFPIGGIGAQEPWRINTHTNP
ncbi:hypothetical protein NXS19_005764 [Fusarium pseudograminearum]|nr:hypothetical protein NXS19_005764 [Fusarium pseudograminearum]